MDSDTVNHFSVLCHAGAGWEGGEEGSLLARIPWWLLDISVNQGGVGHE